MMNIEDWEEMDDVDEIDFVRNGNPAEIAAFIDSVIEMRKESARIAIQIICDIVEEL